MFTANYPSLMRWVNKPMTAVTLTLPTSVASHAGQAPEPEHRFSCSPAEGLCAGLTPQAGVGGRYSQAGFTPQSPGIAEQSSRSGCPWAEHRDPSPLGTLGGPHSQPPLQPSRGMLVVDQSVSYNPKKLP